MGQRLPVARIENNKLILKDAYERDKYILCNITGQMSDGTYIWKNNDEEDETQYQRIRKFGKYFFIELGY